MKREESLERGKQERGEAELGAKSRRKWRVKREGQRAAGASGDRAMSRGSAWGAEPGAGPATESGGWESSTWPIALRINLGISLFLPQHSVTVICSRWIHSDLAQSRELSPPGATDHIYDCICMNCLEKKANLQAESRLLIAWLEMEMGWGQKGSFGRDRNLVMIITTWYNYWK